MKKFHFGDNLRLIRRAKDISQEGIAIRLKISQVHYSRIERSSEIPDQAVLEKLAHIFDLPVEQLVSEWQDERVTVYRFFWKHTVKEVLASPVGVILYLGATIVIIDTVYVIFKAIFREAGMPALRGMWISFTVCLILLIYLIHFIIKFVREVRKKNKE